MRLPPHSTCHHSISTTKLFHQHPIMVDMIIIWSMQSPQQPLMSTNSHSLRESFWPRIWNNLPTHAVNTEGTDKFIEAAILVLPYYLSLLCVKAIVCHFYPSNFGGMSGKRFADLHHTDHCNDAYIHTLGLKNYKNESDKGLRLHCYNADEQNILCWHSLLWVPALL